MDAGISRRGEYGFVGNSRVPKRDVVAQGCGKQHDVLVHHGNGPPQHFLGNIVPPMPIEEDFARPRLVDSRDQARQGRLAGTAGTDHGDALTRTDREVEVLDERRFAAVEPEGDVPEFKLAGKL